MKNEELQEQLLTAWIGLNGILKDSRMTRELTYNEAIIMKLVYDQYCRDGGREGAGRTSVQYILKETNILKSQVNRTLNSLCSLGYLVKERDSKDARNLYVHPVPERLVDFLAVHKNSLRLAQSIIDVIGEEDAEQFVRICGKLQQGLPDDWAR